MGARSLAVVSHRYQEPNADKLGSHDPAGCRARASRTHFPSKEMKMTTGDRTELIRSAFEAMVPEFGTPSRTSIRYRDSGDSTLIVAMSDDPSPTTTGATTTTRRATRPTPTGETTSAFRPTSASTKRSPSSRPPSTRDRHSSTSSRFPPQTATHPSTAPPWLS
jgi:hypothetical protein